MSGHCAAETTHAPPGVAWAHISNVAAWPTWLPTASRVEAFSRGELSSGARFKVYQPKLRPAIWAVIELNPGTNFVWQTRSPGLTLWANHVVSADPLIIPGSSWSSGSTDSSLRWSRFFSGRSPDGTWKRKLLHSRSWMNPLRGAGPHMARQRAAELRAE